MSAAAPSRIENPESRILLVQCCHLPQFFFAARRLRQRYPRARLGALLLDHPQLREYLPLFPAFEGVHFLESGRWNPPLPAPEAEAAEVVFPLLSRGYRRVKKAAARLGGRLWEMDYQGDLLPLAPLRLRRSVLQALHAADSDFADFLREFPHRPLGDRVLLLHTAHESLVEASRPTWERLLPKRCEVRHLKEPDRGGYRELRRWRADSAVLFFSGEKGYFRLKLLPLLLRLRHVLVINENGHAFYLNARSLARFLYHRVRHGVGRPRSRTAVLFLQTEDLRHCDEALARLGRDPLFPGAEVAVLCHRRDRAHFEALAGVQRVIAHEGRLADARGVLRAIREFGPDVVSAVFSGRPVFRKQKLLFFLLGLERRLAFNARLDCYWVTLGSLPRTAKREPLLFASAADPPPAEALLIQTEDDAETARAIRLLASEKVSGGRPVAVFCAGEKAAAFEALPEVRRVYGYHKGQWADTARLLGRLWRTNRDVVAATFSGRPIFRLQKLLFFLLPARSRLVFNEHLDCCYLPAGRFSGALSLPRATAPSRPRRFRWVREVLKVILYLPRFAYLSGWLTWKKLARARLRTGSNERRVGRVG